MKFKNIQLELMMESLKPILPHRDKIGYIAARNTRIISDTLTEYFIFKDELIRKYGEQNVNEQGIKLDRVSVIPGTKNFELFKEEFDKIKDIEHEVELMTLPYEDVIGLLNGEEILSLEWMFTE